MSVAGQPLRDLAALYGIAVAYDDNDGLRHAVSADTVIAALAAFDVDVRDPRDLENALLERRERDRAQTLPACTIAREGETTRVIAHLHTTSAPTARVLLENGGSALLERSTDGDSPLGATDQPIGSVSFELPATLPCGYHTIKVVSSGRSVSGELIVVPRYLGMPRKVGDAQIWGYAVQLYSVTSAGSWGIGDLIDLADLAAWSAGQGAHYLLTNPLHAAAPTLPVANSPYSPISRRFLNPIYLRPEAIAEYAALPDADRSRIQSLRRGVTAPEAYGDTIDRDAVWTAKFAALQAIYGAGLPSSRRAELDAFIETNGPLLRRFALWCALTEVYGTDEERWPETAADPDVGGLEQLTRQHSERIDFYCWLQWVAEQQLAAAQTVAVDAAMLVGIVNDLAVGVDTHSAEIWADRAHYSAGISVGAPPDAYNSYGQGWGLAAWRPDRLAESGYRPFRELVRSILRSCGGLRVDHIMGLFRLWWIPQGHGPTEGTYVHYDHDAMVGILMLEAIRADALVVGEDLGTVEPWVRDYLLERGILGTSVAWFERDADGGPLPAEQYRELCMASVTTHDLAPTEGYLQGEHLIVRDRLGLLRQSLADEQAEHIAELDRWRALLRTTGLLRPGEGVDATEDEILAMHRFLRSSLARVLNAALTDAVGDRKMQNQPGTVDEYPNWRVRLTDSEGRRIGLEDLRSSDRADRLAAVLNGG